MDILETRLGSVEYSALTERDKSQIQQLLHETSPDKILPLEQISTISIDSDKVLRAIASKARVITSIYIHIASAPTDQIDLDAWIVYSRKLVPLICRLLRPLPEKWITAEDAYVETKTRWKQQQEFKATATVLLRSLKEVLSFLPDLQDIDLRELVQSLATYTLNDDPWCTTDSTDLATALLNTYSQSFDYPDIGHAILSETVRPVFEHSRKKQVTSVGTLSASRDHELESSFDTDEAKVWSVLRPEAATLVLFVLSHVKDDRFTTTNWGLIVPPTLSILDDANPIYKTRGCQILHLLLAQTPPQFILIRGLTVLFWDSLTACLAYLPLGTSAISLPESLKLLDEAYDTLLALSSIRAQDVGSKRASTTAAHTPDPSATRAYNQKHARYLSEILVTGIYHSLSLCGEKVEVSELLVRKLGAIAAAMDVYFVLHLQTSTKLLVDILSDPFATLYTPLLFTTLDALDVIIEITVPRISTYRFQLLKGLLVCWKQACESEDGGEDMAELKSRLKNTVALLKAKTASAEVDSWQDTVAAVNDLGSAYRGLL
ncbi:hypothetical protein BZA70DRAFT_277445 [Myxozyma melibiosi]|uniref:Uncharacterized protein n=1 Tax=Myxozyma melibiosi TaxID=54550 RepID=A0ABR1F7W3_9ASCO